MAEPEDVLAEGALHVTRLARELWARQTAGRRETQPRLHDLKRRLELFVAAIFPTAPEIGIAEPPAPPTLLARMARRGTSHLHPADALGCSDGVAIRLPGHLDALPSAQIPNRYRLLALEQAARVDRRTRAAMPSGPTLLRDLYLLSEAAAVDLLLAQMFPRFAPALREARHEAAAARPRPSHPSPREIAMEHLVLRLLTEDPALTPDPFIIAATPAASLRWARERSLALAALPGPYRGMAPVPVWGVMYNAFEVPARASLGAMDEGTPPPGRTRTLPRRPSIREASEDEDDAEPGTWMVRADDLQEKAEDPRGLQRPADRDQHAEPGDLAEALSELPEARLVRTPEPVSEVLAGNHPIPRAPGHARPVGAEGLAYPEWDWRAGAYRARGAVVRERVAPAGDEAWVQATLRRHAVMIRSVRRDFERLRPRRMAIRHQPDGTDLDIDALVAASADRRSGTVADERCYIDTRRVRRDAAITLLVDASASTDGWVAGNRRIIDVEKEALLIVGEALAALGDPHEVLAFSSAGPARVVVQVLKRFEESAGIGEVRRRMAGLEPDGFTRAGAALRHATASLARQPARHRLLLLLSDGRPNDLDQYEGRYGIEDTRMAVAEARLQGLNLFCLTVDRQAPRYASHIFGRDYAVLSRAERLPGMLTALLRHLVRN